MCFCLNLDDFRSDEEQEEHRADPERADPELRSLSFDLRVLAGSVIVTGPVILRVSLEVHRDTLIVQHLAGQDQVLVLALDAPDATRPRLASHRHKREALLADAQVLLVCLTPFGGANGFDPLQVIRAEEGLCGSVAAAVVADVFLPLVLVQGVGCAVPDVPLQERPEAVVPLGKLARSLVFGTSLLPEQETHGQREINPESSHSAAVLNIDTSAEGYLSYGVVLEKRAQVFSQVMFVPSVKAHTAVSSLSSVVRRDNSCVLRWHMHSEAKADPQQMFVQNNSP